jgi:hypothetical protein
MVEAVVLLNTDWINYILAILRSKDQQLLKSIEIEAVQRQQRSWWPASVVCGVQHSLTVTGTKNRDDSDGRFLTVLSIYAGPGQQTITRRNLN